MCEKTSFLPHIISKKNHIICLDTQFCPKNNFTSVRITVHKNKYFAQELIGDELNDLSFHRLQNVKTLNDQSGWMAKSIMLWHARSWVRASPILLNMSASGLVKMLIITHLAGVTLEVHLRNHLPVGDKAHKWRIYPGFEIRNRRHQRSKQGYQRRLNVAFKNFAKGNKKKLSIDRHNVRSNGDSLWNTCPSVSVSGRY